MAKKPTKLPAEASEMPYSSAMSGVMPMTMNSAKPKANPTTTNATVANFVRAALSATSCFFPLPGSPNRCLSMPNYQSLI